MSEDFSSIGEFPGHESLSKILKEGQMPNRPGEKGAAITQNQLDRYIATVEQILKDYGYPTTSMELDELALEENQIAMPFTILLRLAHRTRSAWIDGEMGQYGEYMVQLATATADAKYHELLPYAEVGLKVYNGGLKGKKVREKLENTREMHEAIRREGKLMLESGTPIHDLTSLVHKKLSKKPGYPSSTRQFGSILKPVKDEARKRKTEA